MFNFDRAIIDFEKGYIFETNGVCGVIKKIEDDRIKINLPIVFSKKGREVVNDLLDKISKTITSETMPFDTKLLKNMLDEMDGFAVLEISKCPFGDKQEEAYVLIIRTENQCGIIMSLAPTAKANKYYTPWNTEQIESESQNVP